MKMKTEDYLKTIKSIKVEEVPCVPSCYSECNGISFEIKDMKIVSFTIPKFSYWDNFNEKMIIREEVSDTIISLLIKSRINNWVDSDKKYGRTTAPTFVTIKFNDGNERVMSYGVWFPTNYKYMKRIIKILEDEYLYNLFEKFHGGITNG